jgi:hypothetical protein
MLHQKNRHQHGQQQQLAEAPQPPYRRGKTGFMADRSIAIQFPDIDPPVNDGLRQ